MCRCLITLSCSLFLPQNVHAEVSFSESEYVSRAEVLDLTHDAKVKKMKSDPYF